MGRRPGPDLVGLGPGGEREAAAGARAYAAYIDDGLAEYLRGYVFHLAEGRQARPDEHLPKL
ncbi:hypothetical protein AB0O22_24655 [Streptomyces sp. NPDC091204]|uniref:hypothetical protein n=1 Tax=Streptomyces sp. NPDC091204 TaxID=3155299 RepID=UPI0034245B03